MTVSNVCRKCSFSRASFSQICPRNMIKTKDLPEYCWWINISRISVVSLAHCAMTDSSRMEETTEQVQLNPFSSPVITKDEAVSPMSRLLGDNSGFDQNQNRLRRKPRWAPATPRGGNPAFSPLSSSKIFGMASSLYSKLQWSIVMLVIQTSVDPLEVWPLKNLDTVPRWSSKASKASVCHM